MSDTNGREACKHSYRSIIHVVEDIMLFGHSAYFSPIQRFSLLMLGIIGRSWLVISYSNECEVLSEVDCTL